jgi:2-C-methyl-D-erythritol 4-phosphate cytidylyltransferase
MKKVAVIVAGGLGLRMQSDLPKQFIDLNGLPLLMHTINKFYQFDSSMQIRLVLPDSTTETWKLLCEQNKFTLPCMLFKGGENRYYSVKNGLEDLPASSIVAIHDGVRPLVSIGTISRCFELAGKNGTAVPVIPVSESLRKIDGEDSIAEARSNYRLIQTPQVFASEILIDAYNLPYDESFSDDATVVEKAGYKIYLAEGNEENIKITTPKDLWIAEVLLSHISK